MPRSSRRIRGSQLDSNNDEEMEVDSDSEEVSRPMRRMNVSQNARKSINKARQVDSESEEEPPQVSQRMNGSRKVRNGRGKSTARQIDSESEEEPPQVSQRMNGSRKIQNGRGKSTARQIDSDSDEEPQPSTSQASQKRRKNNSTFSQRAHHSQARPSEAGETLYGEEITASQISPDTSLTEQELNHHVSNVVKYILAADQSNNPIERSAISKAVACHNKKFKDIFESARNILKDVFGYILVEVVDEENTNDGQAKQVKSSSKFILVNTVNCEEEEVKDLCDDADDETGARYALLFLCLAHIFMSGDKCSEDSLRSFLKKLEIITDNHTRHEQFGDAMEVITKVFTKEKYINYDKKEGEFSWGMRANKELKPRSVMDFISIIYDDRKLETWPQEYERLLAKEQQENQRPNGQVNGVNH